MFRKILFVFVIMSLGRLCADEPHGWALVYWKDVCVTNGTYILNPAMQQTVPYWINNYTQTLQTFTSSSCQFGSERREVTEWFPSKKNAIDRINGRIVTLPGGMVIFNGDFVSNDYGISPDDFVGIFQAERVGVTRRQTGSHKETIQVPKEVDIPTMEWVEK